MALHTINLWELVLDGTQIFLGCVILLVLIRNKIKYKQLLLKSPNGENSQNFNTEFVIQAIRQQSDLAFTHIMETIEKERKTLNTYFDLREPQMAPHLVEPAANRLVAQTPAAETSELTAADTIYCEIETLAGQGMSLEDISEELNVPKAEVELVLKLKRLSAESATHKNNPSA
jgi:hypothetical protein